MASIQSITTAVDRYQQNHRVTAITYAVLRKFGDDNGGYLAALITYYGFLSLFPLLLAATSIIAIALAHHVPLAQNASVAVGNLFPLIGDTLQHNIHSASKSGIGLAIGIIVSLFGARGVADALRYAINEIWQVPINERPGFPADIGKSLPIIFVGGGGFLLSSIVSTFIQGVAHAVWATVLANSVSAAIIYLTLLAVFVLAKPKGLHRADMRRGALATAISFQLLTLLGGFLVTRQLHNLNAVYGTFALVLGLLFYIGLQAQIMIYALEYNVVARRRLWPRSLSQNPITSADKEAFSDQAKKEAAVKDETIKVKF